MKVKDKKFYKCINYILEDCIKELDAEFESKSYEIEYKDFNLKIILDLKSIFKHRKITSKNIQNLYDYLDVRKDGLDDIEIDNENEREIYKEEYYTKEFKYVYEFLYTYLSLKKIKKDLYECKKSIKTIEGDSDETK